MNLNIYTIYDTASGSYWQPLFAQADGQAIRQFTDMAVTAENPVGKHPEDYSLHRIGVYNDQNAKIEVQINECIATALECISLSQKVDKKQMNIFQQQIQQAKNNGEDPTEIKGE